MQKKFLNPYKIKKQLKRGVNGNLLRSVISQPDLPHEKDFTWRKTSPNPFRHTEISFRKKLYLFATFFAIFGTLGMAFFHPFFQIQKISVTGFQRIDESEFKSSVQGIMDYKKFFLLPGRSFFLVDVNEIHDILENKYPLQTIIVKKEFPNSLSILLEEKISTVIYDNSRQYSYIGLDGKLVETLRNVGEEEWREVKEFVSSTNPDGVEIREEKVMERYHVPADSAVKAQMGDYPIVYDKRNREININESALEPSTVASIIEWFNFLQRKAQVPFAYMIIENEFRDATIRTGEGWLLRVKLKDDLQNQFSSLDYILREKVDRSQLQYIDLRYGNKVYWQ